MMNPHMKPLRAPLRGSYAPAMQASPSQKAPQTGFSAAAAARAKPPAYPDPGWMPKPGGNALPAQHSMQQMQDAPQPSQSPQMAQGASAQPQSKWGAVAGARAGQPSAQYVKPQAAPGQPAKPKTSVGVATEDLGRYADVRRQAQQGFAAVADQRAAAQGRRAYADAQKQKASQNAYAAADAGVAGAMQALGDPTKQPGVGWDWNAEKGVWEQGNALDTPGEATFENYIDTLTGGPEDFLMPEDVKAAKEGALFTEAAKARRALNDTLGARGIGASGIAASQLGGVDQALMQGLGDLEAQDWAQAQEAYANRLATLGDLSTKFTSEENRMAIQKAMQDAEAKGDKWTAAQEIAAALGADRWAPGAYEAYWDAVQSGIPEEQVSSMFKLVGFGDGQIEIVMGPKDGQAPLPGSDNAAYQRGVDGAEVASASPPADLSGAPGADQWASMSPNDRLMWIQLNRYGTLGDTSGSTG